jgi:HK97 family phage major capsid protein
MSSALKKMESDHKALCDELSKGLEEMEVGPLPQTRGDELKAKRLEAENLQKRIADYRATQTTITSSREVENPIIPSGETKARKDQRKRIRTTPGALFVASDAYRYYKANGKQGWSAKIDVKSIRDGKVELRGEEAEEFETKAFSVGQLSDVGTDAIIAYDRDPEIIRFEEPEILTMRDVINVQPTTSDTVRFVKHTLTERAAASQATRGGLKNYSRVEFETDTISIETIAVLSKVTEQDIDDAPRLIAVINSEMRLDVKVEEERQILWGGGANGELKGLYSQGITEFAGAVGGDTLIDTIRRMRTHLRKTARIVPTAVMIDPVDWEAIELTKANTEQYIWGLISTLRGPMIWSMRVIESDAMTNLESGERRILMGDFTRGATLYDRHDVRLAIGFVDDDFARNLRTLRAEERLAVAVKRPFAFTYAVTAAGTGTYGTGS